MKKLINLLLKTNVGKVILRSIILEFKLFIMVEIEKSNSSFVKGHKKSNFGLY